MLFSTVVDYVASLQIDKSEDPRRRKLWLAFSLVSNLGLLFVFKYLLFTIDNVYSVAGVLGMKLDPVMLRIVLPIGISFYTFQTISYTVDVYRGFIRPERDFILYGCYVTYFPQLVAGPVLRASEVLPQLAERPPFLAEDLADGVRRVLLGLLLKVCLADPIGGFVDTGYALCTRQNRLDQCGAGLRRTDSFRIRPRNRPSAKPAPCLTLPRSWTPCNHT